jgi:drug/metabolite transporter (DMT)-like permease
MRHAEEPHEARSRGASRAGTWRCLVAALLFGATSPIVAQITGTASSLSIAGLLYLGAAIAVTPFVVARRHELGSVRSQRGLLAVAVIAGGAVGPALLVIGLARTSAANGSILLNAELVATTVIAAAVFREQIGRRLVVAVVLVTAGGVLLTFDTDVGVDVGALAIVGACICWGFDNCVTARIDQVPPAFVVAVKGWVAGSANLGLGTLIDDGLPSISATTAVLVVGALGYGTSITLWVTGAQFLGAARAQTIFAAGPFVGALIAWVVFAEPVAAVQLVAMALAAAGVTLSLQTAHDHEHTHEPVTHDHEHRHDDGHHDHDHDGLLAGGPSGFVSHRHVHTHRSMTHRHGHVPDLHHQHHG